MFVLAISEGLTGWAQGRTLAYLVIELLRAIGVGRGIEEMETSWNLEQISVVRKINELLGSVCSKRRRIYAKELVY